MTKQCRFIGIFLFVGELLDEATGHCRLITCTAGYEADDNGRCSDIDECLNGEADCPSDSECQNTDGSYDCVS